MRIAIMQPYFLPYIGYFQLMANVDKFVVYDNIEYTKKGWINRNRFLVNGKDEYFSLPLKKDSDFLHVDKRFLADSFKEESQKMLRRFTENYRKAPYFNEGIHLVQRILTYDDKNLFQFNFHSLQILSQHFGISSDLVVSSTLQIDHSLRAEEKVLAICKNLKAEMYINPIGGFELYSNQTFRSHGIQLRFVRSKPFEYKQFDGVFIPWLSIIDVVMFNPPERIEEYLHSGFDLISNV